MKEVYMDYSATTPVKKEVLDEMLPFFSQQYGNPSSLYKIGYENKEAVLLARTRIAELIGAKPEEIFFTSCGTEADNWALVGTARARKKKGNHIITTKVEHHAILHTCAFLEKEGFDITYLDVDREGQISLSQLEAAITPQTILISVMFANNEVGSIQPIREIAELARKHGVWFHSDAVQALGNVPIDVEELGVDLLSISGHKIYAPKGIGALYIRKGINLSNLMFGGAQESKKRPGTENVAGMVAFGKAAQLAKDQLDEHVLRVGRLRDRLLNGLSEKIDEIEINGGMDQRLPGNLNVIFNYIEGEAILILMDAYGIYASTGSACASGSLAASHVLRAMGVPVEKAYCSIRFTVGDFTTEEDIDYVVDSMAKIVQKLREISPFDKDHPMESAQILR